MPGAAEFFAISEAALERQEAAQKPEARMPASGGRQEQEQEGLGEGEEGREQVGAAWGPPLTIPEGPTEKVTFYLHPMLLKRLELLKAQLLVEHNLKVTRSQIIEYLLEAGLGNQEAVIAALLERAE